MGKIESFTLVCVGGAYIVMYIWIAINCYWLFSFFLVPFVGVVLAGVPILFPVGLYNLLKKDK
jgi:hypothetical protein